MASTPLEKPRLNASAIDASPQSYKDELKGRHSQYLAAVRARVERDVRDGRIDPKIADKVYASINASQSAFNAYVDTGFKLNRGIVGIRALAALGRNETLELLGDNHPKLDKILPESWRSGFIRMAMESGLSKGAGITAIQEAQVYAEMMRLTDETNAMRASFDTHGLASLGPDAQRAVLADEQVMYERTNIELRNQQRDNEVKREHQLIMASAKCMGYTPPPSGEEFDDAHEAEPGNPNSITVLNPGENGFKGRHVFVGDKGEITFNDVGTKKFHKSDAKAAKELAMAMHLQIEKEKSQLPLPHEGEAYNLALKEIHDRSWTLEGGTEKFQQEAMRAYYKLQPDMVVKSKDHPGVRLSEADKKPLDAARTAREEKRAQVFAEYRSNNHGPQNIAAQHGEMLRNEGLRVGAEQAAPGLSTPPVREPFVDSSGLKSTIPESVTNPAQASVLDVSAGAAGQAPSAEPARPRSDAVSAGSNSQVDADRRAALAEASGEEEPEEEDSASSGLDTDSDDHLLPPGPGLIAGH